MDKFSAMQAFCRIVECGSFTRAAEDLGVSAALLSREVSRLEADLGAVLITRTTRRMALTETGRAYYDEAQAILTAVGNFEGRIKERAGQVSGHLRVNAPSSFGQLVVAPMLPAFSESYPDIRVSLSLDDRLIDLIEGGFDLTLRVRASLKDSALRASRIGSVSVGIFASPDYLARFGIPERPEDIGSHRTCAYLLSETPTVWTLMGPDGAVAVPLEPRISVGSSLALRDMLAAGCGLGILPDFISRAPEREGKLRRVLPEYVLPARTVWAICAAGSRQDARVAAFVNALKDAMGRNS